MKSSRFSPPRRFGASLARLSRKVRPARRAYQSPAAPGFEPCRFRALPIDRKDSGRGDVVDRFGLLVNFEVKDGMVDEFFSLIAANAKQSVETEPGCRQFDVLRVSGEPNRLMLYEVYDDEAAFEAHRKMPHLADFLAKVRPMIAKQAATRFTLAAANAKTLKA
jgi:autoinducer 2-degrading protein